MITRSAAGTTLALISAALLAACSSSGGVATTSSPSVAGAPVTAPSSSPSDSASGGAAASEDAGVPVAANPCDVVTLQEASALVGKTLKGQQEENAGTGGTGKRCTYGSITTDVVWVQIAQASSAEAAQAAWDKELAAANAALAKASSGAVKPPTPEAVDGVGDRAVAASWSAKIGGHTIALSAIYLLSGPTFLAFGDTELDHAPVSVADLTTQAQTSLGRL